MRAHLLLLFLIITFISSNKLYFPSDEENKSLIDLPIIQTIDSIRQLANNAFKIYNSTSLNSSLVKQRLENVGFDYFRGKCSIDNISGVRQEVLFLYLKRLLDRLGVPEDRISSVVDQLGSILLKDEDINFKFFNILYNKDNTDNKNVNYIVLIAKFNERMSIDFIHTTLEIDFDFVPDILVANEFLNKKQGEWTAVKRLVNVVPEHLDLTELNTLSAYFELVALYQLGKNYGFELPKPLPLPKKVPDPQVKKSKQ